MNETNLAPDMLNLGRAVQSEIERVIHGQPAAIQNLLVALTAGGHVLLEGVPGVAKTLLGAQPRRRASLHVRAHPVHARSDALGHHRRQRL